MATLGKPGPIGLDVGAHSIKAAQIRPGRGRNVLWAAASLRIPPGSKEARGGSSLAGLMSRVLKSDRFMGRNVVVAASHEDCTVRIIRLPKMDEKELGRAVHFEIQKHLYFADFVTDHKVIRELENADGTELEILVVAARKPAVHSILNSVDSARLRSLAVDVEALASARAVAEDEEGSYCIADVGHTHTNISVFEGPVLAVHRSISIAGSQLAERIAAAGGGDLTEPGQLTPEVRAGIEEATGDLVAEMALEINRSLDYYRDTRGEVEITYLIGGGSSLPGVGASLASLVGAEVRTFEADDSLESLLVDRKHFSRRIPRALIPRFAVAIGLAARGSE